jgi:two-component system sensor histidine kinase KdpD
MDEAERLPPAARRELLAAIREESDRMNRLVGNLLDMTRLESGALQIRKEWHPLEEVVGAALGRLAARLGDRPVTTRLPPDLPLVPLDGVLMEQVLINLLDNAIKYTPAGSPIEIGVSLTDGRVLVEVADRGPGLPPGHETRVFEKFYRGPVVGTAGGVGIGLTICRGIVEAHGGRIWAAARPGGGAVFSVALPVADTPPEVRAADG